MREAGSVLGHPSLENTVLCLLPGGSSVVSGIHCLRAPQADGGKLQAGACPAWEPVWGRSGSVSALAPESRSLELSLELYLGASS